MSTAEDEDLIKNALLFIALRVNKDMRDKKAGIEALIDEGADVNAVDANNKNNTPIHLAVQKGEKEVILLLINKGSCVINKNKDGKTPLDIAKELDIINKQDIINILEECVKNQQVPVEFSGVSANSRQLKKSNNNKKKKDKVILFPKRAGTSGVSGQLYETKLLSLVLLRASNDKEVEEFYLATNIRGIGALDDLCLKYKIKGHDKPILLFLQAKHRDDPEKGRLTVNDVRSLAGDFSLSKYLDSYLRIKERFDINGNDPMFKDDIKNVEFNFVIYTPAKDSFDLKLFDENVQSRKICELINTSQNGVIFQFKYTDDDINYITRIIQEDHIKLLGHTFLEFIMSEKEKYQVMMTDELIRKYHVVLAEKVIQVYGIEPEGYRMGKFRPEFFKTHEYCLIPLRNTLYAQTVEHHCKKPAIRKEEIMTSLKQILKEPSYHVISKLIGNVVAYDDKNNKLELIESNLSRNDFNNEELRKLKDDFRKVLVTTTIINRAIELAAETKLQATEFKLPAFFGNDDLTVRGNDKKVEKRLDFLASKFKDLFRNNQSTKVIEINDDNVGPNTEPNGTKLEYGIIEINGGIGGAVGNLLVPDETNGMLRFNTKESLPEKAAMFLKKLIEVLPEDEDITNYRLKVNINGFPRISFHGDEYDRNMAKDFLSRLWFYTSQAKEDEVETILKKEINKYYNAERGEDNFMFRIHSDAIFLRFHDEIQKWWMIPSDAPYLTNQSDIFDLAKKDVIDSPLLTVLNLMYVNKVKKIGIEFAYDAVNTLKLDELSKKLVNVVTDANILSGIKIKQYFKNVNNYSFIDFDYVLSLPLTDYNTMLSELCEKKTETLIIVYEPPKTARGLSDKLKLIITKFKGNKIVIVTDRILGVELQLHFPDKYHAIQDETNNLNNFTPKSQKKFLEESKIVFQGEEVSLNTVIHDGWQSLVTAKVISKFINHERIEIGCILTNPNYNDIKDYYVDRHLKRGETHLVNTLFDIEHDVVVVTAKPGMGKSTLLTHLSVETKKTFPSSWIARIQLLDYSEEFYQWQQQRTKIDSTKALKFLCKASLRGVDGKTKFELVKENGEILLEKYEDLDVCTLFELKLFITYYNKEKITFLFNGFDFVCPPFEREVINLLKTIESDKKRMWITSNSYKQATNALERAFSTAYTLDPIDETCQIGFFQKFFKTNLKLEQLNHEQFSNISDFLQYMAGLDHMDAQERMLMPWISMPLHLLYVTAIEFFQSELINISSATVTNKLKQRFDLDMTFSSTLGRYLENTPEMEQAAELAGTPLHMYIAANYFDVKIKERINIIVDTNEIKKKWDLFINTVCLYERFLKTNLETLCFQMSDSGVDENVEDEKRSQFITKHKKLALLAICKEDHLAMLLSQAEIDEMKNTIAKIQSGEERSGVVDCVLDGVPRFFHLVFAEYFAVEFLMDILKATTTRGITIDLLKNKAIWDFLVNIFLFTCPASVRHAFDYKLKNDPELVELTSSECCGKIVFDLLLKQSEQPEPTPGPSNASPRETALDIAVNKGMTNLANVLLKSVQANLNAHNVSDFVELVKKSAILLSAFSSNSNEIANSVLECIKNVDRNKIREIIQTDQFVEIPVRLISLCGNERVVENVRENLTAVRDHLAAESQNRFGLSEETVNLIGDVFNLLMK